MSAGIVLDLCWIQCVVRMIERGDYVHFVRGAIFGAETRISDRNAPSEVRESRFFEDRGDTVNITWPYFDNIASLRALRGEGQSAPYTVIYDTKRSFAEDALVAILFKNGQNCIPF